ERKQRLSRAGRAWIERNDPLLRFAVKEKRHVDGNHQAVPLGVTHTKVGQETYATRYSPVLRSRLTAEQNGTGFAGADQLSGCRFDQVLMISRQLRAAQLAPFHRSAL